jgi:UDP-GlcNAc3NAcA epimerase
VVLVYGDTNSTLAGALAAAKLHIPVAHVEAGLRSFNMAMPEEINRILTDRVSNWLFTPTAAASAQLMREGMAPSQIQEVGDVMFDASIHHGARVDSKSCLLDKFNLPMRGYALATIHRAENTDHPERLLAIVEGLSAVAMHIPVVWPLHPRTRHELQRMGLLNQLQSSIQIIEPIGYLDMVQLEKYAAVIATDSGGVQKEAFFHQVPCITLRNETEWNELVDAGWNFLISTSNGLNAQNICNTVLQAIGTKGEKVQPYGAGDAAVKIVNALVV